MAARGRGQPRRQLCAVTGTELGEDIGNMPLDRLARKEQALRNLGVGRTSGNELGVFSED